MNECHGYIFVFPRSSSQSAAKTQSQKQMSESDHLKGKKIWFETEGLKLFDILSQVKTCSQFFDQAFYEDQKCERKNKIQKQINPQFVQHQQEQQKRELCQQRRRDLAMGFEHDSYHSPSDEMDFGDMDDPHEEVDLDVFMADFSVSSTPEVADRCQTRSLSSHSLKVPLSSQHASSQTETLSLQESH